MKPLILLGFALTLAACGVDGQPLTPDVSASQTVGYSSTSGTFSKTSIGFTFGG